MKYFEENFLCATTVNKVGEISFDIFVFGKSDSGKWHEIKERMLIELPSFLGLDFARFLNHKIEIALNSFSLKLLNSICNC